MYVCMDFCNTYCKTVIGSREVGSGGHVLRRDDEQRTVWTSLPIQVCVFITVVPITKLFARGGGGKWRTCVTRDYEPR